MIPQVAQFKDAPRGEGYSARSKTEVASAWAAFRKGEPPPARRPKATPAPPAPSPQAAPLPAPPQRGSQGGPPPGGQAMPDLSAAAQAGGRQGNAVAGEPLDMSYDPFGGEPARPRPRGPVELGVGVRGSLQKPAGDDDSDDQDSHASQDRPHGTQKVYKRQRFAKSGVTQSVDVSALRAELGLESLNKKESQKVEEEAPAPVDEVPPEVRQKEIALRAFIRRVLPSTQHQQVLTLLIRQRLTTLTPDKLAQAAGIKERAAKRYLDDWKAAGILKQDDPEFAPYQLSPSRADLVMIKEFLTLWNTPEWHSKLLGWMIAEEQGR